MGVIDKVYFKNESGSVTSAAPDSQTIINKSLAPATEFIISRMEFWCEDSTVSFAVTNYGPDGTFTAPDDLLDLGFTLRPVDGDVTIDITTTSGTAKRYTLSGTYYKVRGPVWSGFKKTYLRPLVG